MTTITVDFGEEQFPSIPLIAQDLGIEYDDDTGKSVSSEGEPFTIDSYPKASLVRFDCPDEIPDSVFVILLKLPPSKALVLIQENEQDDGFTMKLDDFQNQILEDE